jgi:MFS transporter, ACS family, glucarate transporter
VDYFQQVSMNENRPTNIRWAVFALASGTSCLMYLHRYAFAFVKRTLAEEWGLSNADLGAIDSAFAVCYAVFQIPLGVAADAFGVHLILTMLMFVWFGGMGVMAWAPTARWLWIAQATLGTGQSAVFACLSRIGGMWYPPKVRTTMHGFVGVFAGRAGGLSASLIFTTIMLGVLGLPWRTAIWILVGVGAALMVLFVVVFRNSPRRHPWANESEAQLIEGGAPTAGAVAPPSAKRTSVREMLRLTSRASLLNLLYLSLQSLLSTFADNIYSSWIPKFLADAHKMTDDTIIGVLGALPLLGGAIGGFAGGYLNDVFIALTGNRRWARVGVAFAGKGMAAVLMFAALLFYDRPYVFCACLFLVKLVGDWSLTTAWGVVTDIGGRATASVFAFQNSVATLAQIAAPRVFGHLADNVGWYSVFVAVGVTYILCALSWLLIDCTKPVLAAERDAAA